MLWVLRMRGFPVGGCPCQAARPSRYGPSPPSCAGQHPCLPSLAQGARGLTLTVRWGMISFHFFEWRLVDVRQVFLPGRNTGKTHVGIAFVHRINSLPRKSMQPFKAKSPGQDAPGESPRKKYSFRETAAGCNEHRSSSALWLANRSCS